MFFDTPIYIVFLALVTLLYWRLRRRSQNVGLLAASYFFYGWWDWRFLTLILISTFVDFHCARWIDSSEHRGKRRALLMLSLAVNLTFLGFFKYFNFFIDSAVGVLGALGIHDVHPVLLRILLPPGISFYTFQEVAYIVDVYRKNLKASQSLVDYALFISLFPHLIAGPIQRPSHLLPQVQSDRRFDAQSFYGGLMLILSGLFRKCVVADNCALLANAAFSGRLGEPSLPVVAIGAFAFAWQIYGDFSGYSDIARGSAQLLGFHFMVNFRQPYLARNLQDFWRRWHISLSTWLRDYLFLPISYAVGRRILADRVLGLGADYWIYAIATLVTMLLGGLWHGANWTFVLWGGIFGVALSVERAFPRLSRTTPRGDGLAQRRASLMLPSAWIRRLFVFSLVCLTWVFFRSPSLADTFHLLAGLGRLAWRPEYLTAMMFLTAFSLPLLVLDILLEYRDEEYLCEKQTATRQLTCATVLLAALAFFSANEVSAFIYFQF